jgi:hypothetical protein
MSNANLSFRDRVLDVLDRACQEPRSRKLDQSEATALQSKLSARASELAAKLGESAPVVKGLDVLAAVHSLEVYCATAEAQLATKAASVPTQAAPVKPATAAAKEPAKKLTLTEQVLKARGASSLEQLRALNAGRRGEQN